MSWKLAPALGKLIAEVDAAWPHRSKSSDGTLGDDSHAARKSEHNPNRDASDDVPDGYVTAADITKDSAAMIEAVRKACIADPRCWYVIHNGKIWSRTHDFKVRAYTGPNPHLHHLHISLVQTKAACNSTGPWHLKGGPVTPPVPKGPPTAPSKLPETLKRGAHGHLVETLQRFLGIHEVDYWGATETAVRKYQMQHELEADGIVGPKTWAVILTALRIPGIN